MQASKTLTMAKGLANAIREHALREFPHECCGALLGRDNYGDALKPDGRQILDVLPLPNREKDSPRNRFALTAKDVWVAETRAREQGMEVVGWYHSHPDHPAKPSEMDRGQALPWYSYVIVSVASAGARELRSWRLNDDRTGYSEESVATE